MPLIKNDLFDSVFESVYSQLADDELTYNDEDINGFVRINTDMEKRLGADCDIEVTLKITDLAAIVSDISKSDVISYNGIDYSNIILESKNEFDYALKAFLVLT